MLKGGQKQNHYTDDEFDKQLEKDIDVKDSTQSLTVAPGNIKDDTTNPDEKAYLAYLKSIMDDEAVETMSSGKNMAVDSKGILIFNCWFFFWK